MAKWDLTLGPNLWDYEIRSWLSKSKDWPTSQQTHPKAQTSEARVRLKGRLEGGRSNSGAIQRVDPLCVDDLIEVSRSMNAANPKSARRARPLASISILRYDDQYIDAVRGFNLTYTAQVAMNNADRMKIHQTLNYIVQLLFDQILVVALWMKESHQVKCIR
jgi:hypothetical protein